MATTETTDEAPVIRREDADGVATLTLNRPKSGNSLSHALVPTRIKGGLIAKNSDRRQTIATPHRSISRIDDSAR